MPLGEPCSFCMGIFFLELLQEFDKESIRVVLSIRVPFFVRGCRTLLGTQKRALI